MDAIFGMELPLIVKFVVSFAIVLILIGAAALLVRKFGGKGLIPGAATRGRQPRLAVVDTASVDSRRSLVIVRRDNVEHLLLIGGPTDVLVESNISPAVVQPARGPAPEPRMPVMEPEAAKPAAALPPAPAAPRVEISSPARVEPTAVVESRPEPHIEPVLMPEPRRESEVREPPIPAFAPASPPQPQATARADTPAPEVFVEPRQVPPAEVPASPVPSLPAAAPMDLDEPLARFAQDLNAHRDHMNGQRPQLAHPPSVQPQAPPAQAFSAQAMPQPPQMPPLPPSGAAPARPPGPSLSDEQSLADMAQRLEAALRRPLGANGTRTAPQQPPPRVSATISVRQGEPARRIPGAAPPVPPQPAAARPAPPVMPPQPQQSADEAATYENLQREMASLLGRKPGGS